MSLDDVDRAIASATDWALAQQADDGHWDGNLSSDTTVTAWLAYGLHLWGDRAVQDALDWLCRTRNPDGGWGGAAGEPSHRDATQLALSVLAVCGMEVRGAPPPVGDSEVLGMARVMRAFVRDDPALLSDHSPATMRRLGYIGVLAPAFLACIPVVPRHLHEFIVVSAMVFAGTSSGVGSRIIVRKASRQLCAMWDRQGRWFMPGLSLAALAKYGEGADPVVVQRARSWAHGGQNLDGGWSWCPEGQFLDTALTVGCLADLAGQRIQTSISRAVTWIRARRSPGRGWGQHIAAPPDADDTGAAVLALVASGSDRNDPDVREALDFLCRSQNRNGSWGYPRHMGANLSEDTAVATAALLTSATPRHRSAAQRGVAWLLNHQQPDGSWATRWYVQPEIACWRAVRALRAAEVSPDAGPLVGVRAFLKRSWHDGKLKSSITAEQAAYTLLALGELETPRARPLVEACRWLVDNQKEDGSWPLAATGFMGDVEGAWRAGYTDRMWTHAHALQALIRHRNRLG